MTNTEAFNKGLLIKDSDFAVIILTSKSIDPTLEDENAVSLGWGLVYSVMAPDYTQGKTSETLTDRAAAARVNQGKKILYDNGIFYDDQSETQITALDW